MVAYVLGTICIGASIKVRRTQSVRQIDYFELDTISLQRDAGSMNDDVVVLSVAARRRQRRRSRSSRMIRIRLSDKADIENNRELWRYGNKLYVIGRLHD